MQRRCFDRSELLHDAAVVAARAQAQTVMLRNKSREEATAGLKKLVEEAQQKLKELLQATQQQRLTENRHVEQATSWSRRHPDRGIEGSTRMTSGPALRAYVDAG